MLASGEVIIEIRSHMQNDLTLSGARCFCLYGVCCLYLVLWGAVVSFTGSSCLVSAGIRDRSGRPSTSRNVLSVSAVVLMSLYDGVSA